LPLTLSLDVDLFLRENKNPRLAQFTQTMRFQPYVYPPPNYSARLYPRFFRVSFLSLNSPCTEEKEPSSYCSIGMFWMMTCPLLFFLNGSLSKSPCVARAPEKQSQLALPLLVFFPLRNGKRRSPPPPFGPLLHKISLTSIIQLLFHGATPEI